MKRFAAIGVVLALAMLVGWSAFTAVTSKGGIVVGPVFGQESQPDLKKLEKDLLELEKKAWEGVKNSDPKAMKALLTEDFLEVTESGRRNLQEALKSYAEPSPFKTYELSEIKLVPLSPNSAVLSYLAKMDSKSSAYVCAVYVNRGKGWKLAHWQATGLQKQGGLCLPRRTQERGLASSVTDRLSSRPMRAGAYCPKLSANLTALCEALVLHRLYARHSVAVSIARSPIEGRLMTEGRFDWYEQMPVATADPAKAAIDGQLGAILGKAQGEDGRWSYGVFVYNQRLVWSCSENELAPTGEFDKRESFYSGESIRVSRHGELLG